MHLSKTLLQSIALGITVSAVSSCSLHEIAENEHTQFCDENCAVVHANAEETQHNWENCPACGMG